ncbi:type IV pilus assembly protein/type II secretion system protein F [Gottschalkia acidurici 9a]|uniref:Type IV pilus assembly protein/type II secretion system protein F n=1 Tax=Gottschalkia acidurici (strain ATCC 7906 / DSM 604 / BCRC 14475 / CIP 104303 / KCTC 5404 / NCIMB 10678 / 9a) TaxID=1128398 RepID=K0AWU2_GOTA9|nr:type II secretion system F family protein [Gottschalkia acidurici]AFS78288.1 type IV pilus assembly protein/type II secretion system protein F [Gottschalkia acidurici 9a]
MQKFKYRALDKNYKTVSGVVMADEMSAAATCLKERGLTIMDLSEDKELEVKPNVNKDLEKQDGLGGFGFIKKTDILMVIKQLASLISSGISVVPAIGIIESQIKKKKLKNILRKIKTDVESGRTLSDSLSKFPKYFDEMTTSIIKTGEETGLLDDSLMQVSIFMEKGSQLKKRIILSLIYPSIVLIVSIGVIFFLALAVIPKIIPLITMSGGSIPWNTQLLIDIAEFVRDNIKGIAIVSIIIVLIVIGLVVSKLGKYHIDKYKTYIPLIGTIFKYSAIITFSRTLSILLNSGVSIVQALKSTSDTITNLAIRESINNMADSVIKGENLSDSMKREQAFFPIMVESMIRVGEETGRLDNSLKTLTDMFEEMLDDRIKTMNSLIEPLLLFFIATVVGFVAVGLIAGIMSSYNA